MIVQKLESRALPQFVDDVAICCAFLGPVFARGGARWAKAAAAPGGFSAFALPSGSGVVHVGLNRRRSVFQFYGVPLLRGGIAVGSKDAEQHRIGGDQWKVESIG